MTSWIKASTWLSILGSLVVAQYYCISAVCTSGHPCSLKQTVKAVRHLNLIKDMTPSNSITKANAQVSVEGNTRWARDARATTSARNASLIPVSHTTGCSCCTSIAISTTSAICSTTLCAGPTSWTGSATCSYWVSSSRMSSHVGVCI